MTLAAGFKFEHPKTAGVSPVLLLSDSRYSRSGKVYRDDGKKIWAMGKNVFAAFAGTVHVAQRALETARIRWAQCSSDSFADLKSILIASFDGTMRDGDGQPPHCIVAGMAADGSSKLFYAQPAGARYEIMEKTDAIIALKHLEPILQEKIAQAPAGHGGLWHPKHFMSHPDGFLRNDEDRRKQTIKDARDISFHIATQFLEVVNDPNVTGANPPLQTLLLTPGRADQINLYDVVSPSRIARKTAHANEVSAEPDLGGGRIVELTVF
jgi:hypothetical protein